MRNILLFIIKFNYFFLFLLLEIFCFILIVQHNNYHKASFINTTNDFFSSFNQRVNNIYDYFHLTEINRQLAEENARLKALELTSYNITDKKKFVVNDTLYKQEYSYIEAKVVNNSVNRRKNYITINKGTKHGIKRDMGVIAPQGVVGIVTHASPHYATVMSVLHIDTKISAQQMHTSQMGSLTWDGTNYRKGKLNDMPTHVVLHPGDTIITSGFSAIFPQGIPIGYVLDYSLEDGNMFFDVNVAFAVDYNKLSYVYVVNNILKTEQIILEKRTQND